MELDQQDLIEKQLKANEGELQGSSISDLVDPNSRANKISEIPRQREEIKKKPTIDEEGYPVIQTLRTYNGDVADAVKEDNLTVTKMAVATQKRQEAREKGAEINKKPEVSKIYIFGAIVTMILFVGGVGAVAFTFFKKENVQTTAIQKKEPSVLASEQQVSFDITKAQKMDVLSRMAEELSNIPKDQNVREIIPTIKLTEGSSQKATIEQFLGTINTHIPDKLLRSLYPNYFLGINFAGTGEPFMVFFTSSYDIAYPSLLEWEGFLKDDLAAYFYPSATSTSDYIFKDVIIYNHDTRALQGKNGDIAFFYTIIDSKTIIFARTSSTLKEILERIRTTKLK